MRRENKIITKTSLVGATLFSLFDIFKQWNENKKKGIMLTWENFDGTRTFKAGAIGFGLGYFFGKFYYENLKYIESKENFSPNKYLNDILKLENVRNNPPIYNATKKAQTILISELELLLAGKTVDRIQKKGSFEKRTANLVDFDLDILIPFKKDSFGTLEEMYNYTFEILNEHIEDVKYLQKTTKGFYAIIEMSSFEVEIDIIPAREVNDYRKDGKLKTYKRNTNFWGGKGSSFKIDSALQSSITRNKYHLRRAIRLIKLYNTSNNLKIPSAHIEQSLYESMLDKNFGSSYSDKINFIKGLNYLLQKLEQNHFLDHSNSNNNLNNKMSDGAKIEAIRLILKDLNKIESDERHLIEIF